MYNCFVTRLFTLAFTVVSITVSFAQVNDSLKNETLRKQFNSLIIDAESYNEYKVIKSEQLNAFEKVIVDSVKTYNKVKNEALSKISIQQTNIEKLEAIVTEKEQLIVAAEEEKSNISVLGILINKQSYAIISLIIPLLLIIAIIGLMIKLKSNSVETKEAKSHLITVENEFENYKKKALDNQMKLKRELQTERNKLLEYNK